MSEVIMIDANVLKEIWELYEKYQPSLATNVYEFGVALKGLIDNALTVEPDVMNEILPEITAILKDIMPQLIEIAKGNIRPQGEWIDCGNYYRCPFCENWFPTEDGKPKFCDECGADMRGKMRDTTSERR